jgi:hypothetical protein
VCQLRGGEDRQIELPSIWEGRLTSLIPINCPVPPTPLEFFPTSTRATSSLRLADGVGPPPPLTLRSVSSPPPRVEKTSSLLIQTKLRSVKLDQDSLEGGFRAFTSPCGATALSKGREVIGGGCGFEGTKRIAEDFEELEDGEGQGIRELMS